MSLDDKGQCRRLHATYGEGRGLVLAAAIFEGIETGGVHAEEPVADSAAQAGLVE